MEVIVPKDLIFEGISWNNLFSNIVLGYREENGMVKNWEKLKQTPDRNPDCWQKFETSNLIGNLIKQGKKGARHSPNYRYPPKKIKRNKEPHKETPRGNIQGNERGDTRGPQTHALIEQKQSEWDYNREGQ